MATLLLNTVCPYRNTLSWRKPYLWFLTKTKFMIKDALTLIYHKSMSIHSLLEVSAINSGPRYALMPRNSHDYMYNSGT
jgi:hypothetical protein